MGCIPKTGIAEHPLQSRFLEDPEPAGHFEGTVCPLPRSRRFFDLEQTTQHKGAKPMRGLFLQMRYHQQAMAFHPSTLSALGMGATMDDYIVHGLGLAFLQIGPIDRLGLDPAASR